MRQIPADTAKAPIPMPHAIIRHVALTFLPIALLTSTAQADEPYPGIVQSDCPEQTQLGLNRCAYEWEQATLVQRGKVYDTLAATLAPEELDALAGAEATWQAFESTYCAVTSEGYREGSIYPLILLTCRANRNNERVVALTQWEPDDTPWPDYFVVLPQMEAAYASALEEAPLRVQAVLPGNQMLWEAYRNQHCDWEARQPRNDSPQGEGQVLNHCFTRLTLQRIEQLRFL